MLTYSTKPYEDIERLIQQCNWRLLSRADVQRYVTASKKRAAKVVKRAYDFARLQAAKARKRLQHLANLLRVNGADKEAVRVFIALGRRRSAGQTLTSKQQHYFERLKFEAEFWECPEVVIER